jgi:formylglycine-generating enzyme required for sulfatase activity
VSLQVSNNGGSTFSVPATTLSGAIGAGVTTGTAKKITWDAGVDWSGQYSTQMRFKVIADDGNSAPTISDIADQTITEGGNTGAIAFTIGDAQTAASSLTLSGSSSNTTLVPNANIVFGGSGANRTVTVTPASSQSGTATITVTVSDGSLTSSDTFVLTVNSAPANTAPTISDIAALTINEGGNTGALAFTVGDVQTTAGSLTLSGSSSNTTLVPNANIVFGGSEVNRTVTVTPASGQSGTATITVTVSDGTLSTSDTFLLAVNANTAPTISDIVARRINQGSNTGALAFTISDAQTAAASLTLSASSSNTTLVPNANIVFGGSGDNRTVTVTPVSGQSGTATITVTVSDGSLSTSDTFVLTVNSAPTIYRITGRSILVGGSTGEIDLDFWDPETTYGSLALSGSSNNTTLVPNANILFGVRSIPYARTLTVVPASGQTGTARITVTVSDGSLSASTSFSLSVNYPAPTGFALVTAGSFTMGDSRDGDPYAPTRTVTLDTFYMGKYEVTKAEWDQVRTWGLSNGYTDLAVGGGKANNHPVNTINWYDIVKWCNARSQKEGLTPVYYTNDAQTTIYKIGRVDVTNAQVKWIANGYRLPTSAEWEKAARGGLSRKRFPLGDTISHSQANYRPYGDDSYDLSSSVDNYHPTYATGSLPYTSPVGAFAANGYGLYDMAGNVWELCWNWSDFSAESVGSQTNPRGPSEPLPGSYYRTTRGGGWESAAYHCRVSYEHGQVPLYPSDYAGFRLLRSSVR